MEEALAAVQRTLATTLFYPANHPLLRGALAEGYRAWERIEGDPRLASSGVRLRSGSLWLGDAAVGEQNPGVRSLAKTFAGHGLVCAIQRRPLSEEGFAHWVELLAATPDSLAPGGGLTGVWKESPFADRLELRRLAVAPTSREEEAEEPPACGGGDPEEAPDDAWAPRDPEESRALASSARPQVPGEARLVELLLRLGRTDEVADFVRVLRDLGAATRECVLEEKYPAALQVALFLYREAQNLNALGEAERRDALNEALLLLLRGAFLDWMVGFVVAEGGTEDAKLGEYVLRAVGKPAV
ncbi:MAG: hypothetical protein HGA98_01790, partial [Deltaproteobacteria bacterium]|nr:hypothetical protein [Deltaproteobacteria bacterium]